MGAVLPAGMATAGGFAAIAYLAEDITGSDTLAGLAGASASVGAALATLPIARHMARRGRRPGLRLGWSIAFAGAALAATAAIVEWYPLLVLGGAGMGVGNATNLSARYAAADLARPAARARSIGVLVWASAFGSVLGPSLALGAAGSTADAVGLPELAGPYLLAMVLFAGSALVAERLLRPDPLVLAGGVDADATVRRTPVTRNLRRIATHPDARLAVLAMLVGQGVMVGIMTMTPVHMKDGDHELRIVGLVISLHIVGMYFFAPVVGWLVDTVGPRLVIAAGSVTLFCGAELASHTDPEDRLGVFVGLFLIGIGWSFGLVAGSTLLTGSVPVEHRVDVQGTADLIMVGAGAAAGLTAGAAVEWSSYHALSHWSGVVALGLLAAIVLIRPAPAPA